VCSNVTQHNAGLWLELLSSGISVYNNNYETHVLRKTITAVKISLWEGINTHDESMR